MGVIYGGLLVVKEPATGPIDGTNRTFTTTYDFIPDTLIVYLNGMEQASPGDYVELTTQSFQFTEAPIGGADPDRVAVVYPRA
jgi:hypothetical protein